MVAQISVYNEISALAHLYQFEWARLQNKVEMFYFSSVYVSIDENEHLNRKIFMIKLKILGLEIKTNNLDALTLFRGRG